jgi:hypothetical protein
MHEGREASLMMLIFGKKATNTGLASAEVSTTRCVTEKYRTTQIDVQIKRQQQHGNP